MQLHGNVTGHKKIMDSVYKRRVLRHNGARYVVSPYALIWDGDYYYMVGFNESFRKNKIQCFRLDRIKDQPEILDEDEIILTMRRKGKCEMAQMVTNDSERKNSAPPGYVRESGVSQRKTNSKNIFSSRIFHPGTAI